jgi:fatty acid desaturase
VTEFKKRLKETILTILLFIILLGVGLGFASFMSWLTPDEVAPYIALGLVCVIFLFFFVAGIIKLIKFINWLFIEPFRKGRG